MLAAVRILTQAVELLLGLPFRAARFLVVTVAFNPRLGPLRHLATLALAYVVFALILVYVAAPLRGVIGSYYLADKIRYDAERWLATAIYDRNGHFIGSFEGRLDSRRDVNFSDQPIEIGDYVANPDHKSIAVPEVPPAYWDCLSFHEDRYLGGLLNPYGIDLLGVLKIPLTTVKRTFATMRPSLGVGGSTLPMQFARVIANTPPNPREGGLAKLRRKIREWWMAPVIYHVLTTGGDHTPLKRWAADHIWLAQRTGGAPLHGVEMTSRIVFGKEAKDLSVAEQYVLASAVNKPIILLQGNEKLNAVRLDRWRYITEVRARTCAERLITDPLEQRRVVFELVQLAGGPPDPKVKPKLQATLETYAPALAKRAEANPFIRANALLPSARFGLREEMKQSFGFGWREMVRGVTTTLDVADNLAFSVRVRKVLADLEGKYAAKLAMGYTLDPAKVAAAGSTLKSPHVVVVAANARGEIVRYYEAGETAPYFGSVPARDPAGGHHVPAKETRRIASTGKILIAIGIGNEGRDGVDTVYADAIAPERNLESCDKGPTGDAAKAAPLARTRRAIVAFACSLNRPIEWRAALLGQPRVRRLIETFGFAMPPPAANGEGTPPSTAAARGLLAGSPRQVHQMAHVLLASLTGNGSRPVRPPTLVRAYEHTSRAPGAVPPVHEITPDRVIRAHARAFLKAVLQAPFCLMAGGSPIGTLKSLAHWCPDRRADVRLLVAKTGTDTSEDPNATVDTWITGGIQFANGAAYSFVVLVGTGSTREPFARALHASQLAAPLLDMLLDDLKGEVRGHPGAVATGAPRAAAAGSTPSAEPAKRRTPAKVGGRVRSGMARQPEISAPN